jgi:hypothetical protein
MMETAISALVAPRSGQQRRLLLPSVPQPVETPSWVNRSVWP